MATTSLGTKRFRSEAQRRIVSTHEVMLAFGLRSKQGVLGRVARGTLPPPIITKERTVSLWDADEIKEMTGTHVTPDRKES